MNELELKYNLMPLAHQSFRFARNGRKYKPKKIVDYQNYLIKLTEEQLPDNWVIIPAGAEIVVEYIHYSYAYLKGHSKKKRKTSFAKTTKPDLQDNLNKPLFDALEGLVYEQDQNIVEINNMKKFYSDESYIKLKISYEY
jgi:Holliday junction resolvase RusA-like endonuclease